MAIPIQCPECHKRYQAPDHMAGRRVKCKYCGVVFLIAGDNRTESPDFDRAQLDELSALADTGRHDAAPAGGAASGGTATAGGKLGAGIPRAAGADEVSGAALPRGAVPGEESDFDAVFQRGDFHEAGARRTNKLYIFPMSRLLDRWLPPVLLAIGVVWVCREGWSRNPTGRPWVGAFRAGMFLLAFFAAIYPFTLMGIRAAARRLNYDLPPRVNLRVLGAFAVPAALAAALWLIYQDVTGLLLGSAIGVAVALPVVFLLLRLLPSEAPITFAYAAGSFLLSVVVAAAALFALNLMLVGILRSAKTEHALTMSPFGPGFHWDGPYHPDATKVALSGGDDEEASSDESTSAATSPSTNPSGDDSGAARPLDSAPTTRESTGSGPGLVENGRPSTPTVPPDVAGARGAPKAVPGAKPNGAGSHPFLPDTGVAGAGAQIGGIVKGVRTVLQGDDITAVVRPAVPGPWIAVARPGVRGSDRVERWNTETWKPAGEIQVARDPNGNAYVISPDGEYLAYLTAFPSLSVQVWSLSDGRLTREIRLKTNPREDWGSPRLLGFSRPDQFVLHWRRGNLSGLEVHTVKGSVAPRHFDVEDFDASPGTYAFSPDGQAFSVLWRGSDTGGVASYSLATAKLVRSFQINVLDWRIQVRPAGLAYSPDGGQIAAVIEGEGQGLFAAWPVTGKPTRPLFKHVVPVGSGAAGAANGFSGDFEGPAFQWLDDGKAYLLYGSSVFETETGRFLGDVGLDGVRAHLGGGKDVIDLVRTTDTGHVQIDAVTFDLGKARDSASAVTPASKAPAKPATRRSASSGQDKGAGT